MIEFLSQSAYFGVFITLAFYWVGLVCKAKFKLGIFNPLVVSITLTIAFVAGSGMGYPAYYAGAKYLSYLLTPATVCLAVPLYKQLGVLKRSPLAIAAGIGSGVLASVTMVLALSVLLGFTHQEYVTFLPKSITTAIGMDISDQLGGYASITVAVIILTGVLGNALAESFLKLIRVTDPVAKGVAIGTASHALGTARALELGETEGAISSLSIAVAGLLTVPAAVVFSLLW